MSNSWLPWDLLLDVLARLPVESLLRFRNVSKSWAALIDSKEFIKLQLNRSITNPKAHKLLLTAPNILGKEHSGIKTYNLYTAELDLLPILNATCRKIHHPFLNLDENISLVGSCDGLLCIKTFMDSLVLYNPWTKKDWKVPDEAIEGVPNLSYGFGHDDINDDYKVVRIFNCREVHIYSLNSNSWRRIQDLSNTTSYSGKNGVLANCSLHWLSSEKDSIIAIDLRTEKYHLVPLPEFTDSPETGSLGVLNGCLSVVTISSNDVVTWVMKDYGIKNSWTKLMEVQSDDLFYLLLKPIAYSETKKQLIFHYSKGFLGYDLERKTFERILLDARCSINAYCCVQSLVQPCGAGGCKRPFRRTKKRRRT